LFSECSVLLTENGCEFFDVLFAAARSGATERSECCTRCVRAEADVGNPDGAILVF
jgi:hypothetical protein